MSYLICAECQKKVKLKESHEHRVIRCEDCGGLFCPVCEGVCEGYDIAEILAEKPHQCGICLKMIDEGRGERTRRVTSTS